MRRQCSSSGCQPCRFFTSIPARRSRSNQRGASGTRASTKLVCVGNTCTPGSVASAACEARALRLDRAACSASSARSREQHRRDGLRQRVEIIRLADLVELRRPLGRRDRVAQAQPRHPDLRDGPHHDEVRKLGEARQEARVRERVVRLVDDDQPGCRAQDGLDVRGGEQVARRIVGIGEKDRAPAARARSPPASPSHRARNRRASGTPTKRTPA